jgi:membrane protein DedA with SNARE-associated domain
MVFSISASSENLLSRVADAPPWTQGVMLALATFFISEDLTTLAAGLMVAQGEISWAVAFWGCFLGIFLGDGLLYLLGLLVGRPVLNWPFFRYMLSEESVRKGETWFEKHGIAMVFISRFLPGTRLPTYFAAGVLGAKAKYFLITALLACFIWTPVLLIAAYEFGQSVLFPFEYLQNHPLITFVTGVIILLSVFKFVHFILSPRKRIVFRDSLYRTIHWEFWPLKVFYAPILIYNLALALRFRSMNAPLHCNPAISFSGFAGESKSGILNLFEGDTHLLNFLLFNPLTDNLEELDQQLEQKGILYPFIMKPDQGERGNGVQNILNREHLHRSLQEVRSLQILQERHPGPLEFGLSYVRLPGKPGHIMGITGKKFPELTGDGIHTQKELMLKNPDIRGRLRIFMADFNDRILEMGETRPLTEIGNHCLGTIFYDCSHLITPALEDATIRLATRSNGVFIGRFDVRAESLTRFQCGDFKLLEFNGATSEPSYVYDSSYSLIRAWHVFFQYWTFIWKIGLDQMEKAEHKWTWLEFFRFSTKKE